MVSRPRRALTWVALAVLAVGAAATVGVMVRAATYDPQLPTSAVEVGLAAVTVVGVAAFVVWALAPFVAMAAVALAVDRRDEVGPVVGAVVAVGALAVTGLGGWALVDFVTSESSTAALVFIFLPFYQLVVVAATTAVALGAHALVRRRRGTRR